MRCSGAKGLEVRRHGWRVFRPWNEAYIIGYSVANDIALSQTPSTVTFTTVTVSGGFTDDGAGSFTPPATGRAFAHIVLVKQ